MTAEDERRLAHYKEVSLLDGGHGVYLVRHDVSGRMMVRKRLDVFNSDIYSFLKLHHVENTPYIYEVVEDGDSLVVVEEYIEGSTLKELLEREGVLPLKKAAEYMAALCGIISELHHISPPIIHRDIKPSNIIITPDGQLKLIDLNAAKYQDNSKNRDTELIGTEGYAAPEQYGFGASDTQTDIYAAGVLFNVMLTGVFPQEMVAPGTAGEIIRKCTRLERSERYENVDFLKAELECLAGRPAIKKQDKATGGGDDSVSDGTVGKGIIIGIIAVIGNIPGFRSGGIMHKIFSAILYIIAFAVIIAGGRTFDGTTGERVLLTFAMLSIFIGEVLFIGNCGGVCEKFAKVEKGQPVPKKKIILGAFLVFLAICAVYAVLMIALGY